MGFFDGSSGAKAGGEGGFKPGVYQDMEVLGCRVLQGHHGTRFLIEYRTLSDGTPNHETIAPAKAGETGSVGVKIEGEYRKSALGEVNGWTGALEGMDIDTVNARLAEADARNERAISPEQPHKGKIMRVTVYEKITGKGNKMTKQKIEPWDGRKVTPGASVAPEALAAPAAPAAPPPQAATPAPVAGDWFDFPATDPRHGVERYNAAGETRPIA